MSTCFARIFALMLLAAPFASVQAQGTITDGAATFIRTASSWDITPEANMGGTGVPSGDPLFEAGWWFRVSGDGQEFAFPIPTTQNYAGNTSTLAWTDVAARGLFSAQEVATVTATSPGSRIQQAMTITNLSATNPLTISVFHFIDIDTAGTAASDSGSMEVAPLYRISMSDIAVPTQTAQYYGVDADAYAVLPFSASTDVAALLSNATVNDFANTGVPFTNIDMTAGMEWMNEEIAPGASRTFVARWGANTTAFVELPDPLFSDGFEDPPTP